MCKVFCKVVNNRLVQYLDCGGKLHEGQAGFSVGRSTSCMDNVNVLNEVVQGRKIRSHMHSFQM